MSTVKSRTELLLESKKLQTVPNISLGGCGIAAYALAEKSGVKKPKFALIFDYGFSDMISFDPYPGGANFAPFHVLFMVDSDTGIDEKGFRSITEFLEQPDFVLLIGNKRHLEDLIVEAPDWNESFHRPSGIPLIEKLLKIRLPERFMA